MKKVLAFVGALVTALVVVMVVDALDREWMRSLVLEVSLATLLGAATALWLRLVTRHGLVRRARAGSLLAGASAFVLARIDAGWVDLGPIGAGPPGELALLVLPFVTVVALAGALAVTPAITRRRD